MPYFYVDAATGTDSLSNGGDWTTPCASLLYLQNTATANPTAGDTVFIRANASETTKDQEATTFAIDLSGTINEPVEIIGVKPGTINEGASVVASDFAVRGDDNPTNNPQPVLEVTGVGADMTFDGCTHISYVKLIVDDRLEQTTSQGIFYECDITMDNFLNAGNTVSKFHNCTITIALDGDSGSGFANTTSSGGIIEMYGGEVISSLAHNNLIRTGTTSGSVNIFQGVDLTSLNISAGYINTAGRLQLKNCKIPTGESLMGGTPNSMGTFAELIHCSDNASAKGGTTSYQDYQYEDYFGTVDIETTVLRTGGASDGASGAFSYAMEMAANRGKNGIPCYGLKSPWLRAWTDSGGGSRTYTVYIVNDGAGDLTEAEIYCEFYTPDAGDTAQHTQTFDPVMSSFLEKSSTAVTDDTSTWASVNTFKQKFSVTVAPGFEGWVYARVWLHQRSATPDIVYVDPIIVVT